MIAGINLEIVTLSACTEFVASSKYSSIVTISSNRALDAEKVGAITDGL